jgi:type VI secretion system protein ImpG
MRTDSDLARMLATLSTNNVLLGCTPVVNLFRQRGEPIRLTHATASYPVLADARRAFAYAVQAIESVKLVRQTPQGESVQEFRPFYSLRHGQTPENMAILGGPARRGHRRKARLRNADLIVDIDFDPAEVETDTLSLELTCTNRDLPASLSYGMRGGVLGGGSSVRAISFLRKPTPSYRFARARCALAPDLAPVAEPPVADRRRHGCLPRDAHAVRPAAFTGVAAADRRHRRHRAQAANTWLPGIPFACLGAASK